MDEALKGMRRELDEDIDAFQRLIDEIDDGTFKLSADSKALLQRTMARLRTEQFNISAKIRD